MINTNICAYCKQSRQLTKEHVYPDFFKQFFNTDAIITDQLQIHNFPIKPLDITVNDVCKDCNNDELAKLDRSGKSIIKQIIDAPNDPLHYEYPTLLRWLLKLYYNIERYYKLDLCSHVEDILDSTLNPAFNLYAGRIGKNNLTPNIVGFKTYPFGVHQIPILIFNSVFFVISKTELFDDSLIKIDPQKNEVTIPPVTPIDYLDLRISSSIMYPEVINRKIKSICNIPKEPAEIIQKDALYEIAINVPLPPYGEIVLNRLENVTQIAFIPINSDGKNVLFFEAKQSRKKWTALIKYLELNTGKLHIVSSISNTDNTIVTKVTMINGTIKTF